MKENENENTNIKKMINNLFDSDYIKEGWFDKETSITDSIIDCIKKCTSPRASKKNNPITEDDLKRIFKAFSLFKPSETRVLILGQDPYPDNNRAHGLAFSFKNKQKPAEDSLLNIFKAIQVYKNNMEKYFCDIEEGDVCWGTNLKNWASTKKILLLNTALTYNSKNDKTKHQNSWEAFLQQVIKKLLTDNNKMTIFLWGVDAQKKFLKCLNNNYLKNIYDLKLTPNIKKEQDKYVFQEKNFKLINIREVIDVTDNIKIYMTSHPSNNYNAVKHGFCCNAPYHFKACDDFLEDENGNKLNIWKDFPENNT